MFAFPAVDTALFYGINHGAASPVFDAVGHALTWSGEHAWVLAPAIPFIWKKSPDGWKIFWALLLPLLFLSDSIPNLLKALFERDRPFTALPDTRLILPVERLRDFGFPSNHATNSFAVAGLAAFSAGLRPATLALYGAAVIVSLSRVYLGVHYPLDIAAGALLGTGIAAVLRAAHARFVEKAPDPQRAYWKLVAAVAIAGGAVQIAWRLVR